MYNVSVIVPVYKSAQYIERCVVSLMEQTCQNIEYVFVNDASPDNSVSVLSEILNKYPERLSSVKIINNETNKGTAETRNIGLQNATGEYIAWCDSDDWVEKDMYGQMFDNAKSCNADIAWCNYICEYGNNNSELNNQNINAVDNISCIKAILTEKMHGGMWNKIVKRSLITENNIHLNNGANICEDNYYSISIFSNSKKNIFIDKYFYHYVKFNDNAISKQLSVEKIIGLHTNVLSIVNVLKQKKIFRTVYREAACCIIPINVSLLLNTNTRQLGIKSNLPKMTVSATLNARTYVWWYKLLYLFYLAGWIFPFKMVEKILLYKAKHNENSLKIIG